MTTTRRFLTVAFALVLFACVGSGRLKAADILSVVPEDAMVVVYTANMEAASDHMQSFAQAVCPESPGESLVDKMLGNLPGDTAAGGLKVDGPVALVLTIADPKSPVVLFEMADYPAYIKSIDQTLMSKSPMGMDQYANGTGDTAFVTELGNGIVAGCPAEDVLASIKDMAKRSVKPISQTVSADMLAALKKGDVGVLAQVDILRTAFQSQIMLAKMSMIGMLTMQMQDATPAQKMMMSTYYDWVFSIPDQIRTVAASLSLNANGVTVASSVLPETGSTFAGVVAAQTAGSIPAEKFIPEDASMAVAWQMDYAPLTKVSEDLLKVILDLADPEPAPLGANATPEQKQAYSETLKERDERHANLLSMSLKALDMMDGGGYFSMNMTAPMQYEIFEAIGAADAKALKDLYDTFTGEMIALTSKIVPGVEYTYEPNAREVLGTPASLMTIKVDPNAAAAGGGPPMPMQPGMMGGGECLLFPAAKYLVVSMNEPEAKMTKSVDDLKAGRAAHGADSPLSALLAKLPAQRNVLMVGNIAKLAAASIPSGAEGAPPVAAGGPGFAMSAAMNGKTLDIVSYLSVEEIVRISAMGAASMAGPPGAPDVEPADDSEESASPEPAAEQETPQQ